MLRPLGLGIRSAIHTGEIEICDDDVGGIGVHIAARALAEAGDRQVIVTRTLRDLATGIDLVFSHSARSACEGFRANGSCSKRPSGEGTLGFRRYG